MGLNPISEADEMEPSIRIGHKRKSRKRSQESPTSKRQPTTNKLLVNENSPNKYDLPISKKGPHKMKSSRHTKWMADGRLNTNERRKYREGVHEKVPDDIKDIFGWK